MSLSTDAPWVVWVILVPLIGALLAVVYRREGALIGVGSALFTALCVAVLTGQFLAQGAMRHHLGGWGAGLGIDLHVDGLSALMLIMTALIGVPVGVYASAYFRAGTLAGQYFWPLWLMLWAGLNALFLAADLFNVYVTLELVGLAAVSLAALGAKREALAAAMRYLLVSLLGSLTYLLGVALLYLNYGTLDLAQLGELLRGGVQQGSVGWVALALMSVGLMLKTALFPLHFWLPGAHANAPAPVSALLSALVVKASFYLLLRLWFELFNGVIDPLAAQLIGGLGAAAIVWGSVLALRQSRLKLIVAYSTVAQLGYLFVAFPLIIHDGDGAWRAVVFFAFSHAVAKAAMFLGAGTIMHRAGHDRLDELGDDLPNMPLSMLAFAFSGVSLIGLPPSGGFLAKWMLLEAALRSGQWWWALVILSGGVLAAAYVFRVLAYAFNSPARKTPPPRGPRRLTWSALVLALLALALGFTAAYPLELLMGDGVIVSWGVTP